jgi:DNA anti-recombination protein RmuC
MSVPNAIQWLRAQLQEREKDLQHVLDTCVPIKELRQAEAELDTLKTKNDKLRARAVVAEQHKTLSLLGKSSYQEVVEERLRVQLAETQVELDTLKASLREMQDEMQQRIANVLEPKVTKFWLARLAALLAVTHETCECGSTEFSQGPKSRHCFKCGKLAVEKENI